MGVAAFFNALSFSFGAHSVGILALLRRPDASFHNCGEQQLTAVPVLSGRKGRGAMVLGTKTLGWLPFLMPSSFFDAFSF